MGLKKCLQCKKDVETITDFCPECGNEIMVPKQAEGRFNPCGVIFLLFVVFFGFMILFANPEGSPDQNPRTRIRAKKWYDGGTLHQKTIKDWKQATRENKLATCADFAVSHPNVKKIIENSDSVEAVLPYAIQLVAGIDEYAKDNRFGNHKVSETAAMLMIILKW